MITVYQINFYIYMNYDSISNFTMEVMLQKRFIIFAASHSIVQL